MFYVDLGFGSFGSMITGSYGKIMFSFDTDSFFKYFKNKEMRHFWIGHGK